jgi:ethanolamine-phosphate cytidylyltransferase
MSEINNPYILKLLLSLKEGKLFKDTELFSQLKVLSENFHSEEAAQKAKQDATKFIDFYHKNTSINTTAIVRAPSNPDDVPLRMYVDGVFDMVHSGHFNAIRQV